MVGVVGAAHKKAAALRAGAHTVIDKSSEPLWPAALQASPGGYDAVFDANGVETLAQSYRALAPMGRLVIYGFHTMMPKSGGRPNYLKLAWDYLRTPRFFPLQLTGDNKSVMAFNLSYLFEHQPLLSQAMAQLLALARARLVDPPILLLDEATSNLDLHSEARVQRAMRSAAAGRTTVLVAHRLQTARLADRILVVEGGRIVQDGTHDDLLATPGRYRDLWSSYDGASS